MKTICLVNENNLVKYIKTNNGFWVMEIHNDKQPLKIINPLSYNEITISMSTLINVGFEIVR